VSAGARSLAATFVTLGLAYGVWYSYAVFLVALLGEFGWSRSLLAGAFSVFTLVHGLAGAPLGWLADRLGPRRLVLGGGALLALGLALDGAVSRPWHLYLTFGLLTGAGVAAAGWMPAVVLVQRWFPHRLGTMLGITSAGIGVGIFLVVPLAQYAIDLVGWRWAFRLFGATVAAWVLPATLWLVRDPPRPAPAAPTVGPAPPPRDVTLREALGGSRYWLLAVSNLFGAFIIQMLLVHQVAYLVDHGVTSLVAATVVGLVGIGSIVGKGLGGWASDVVGREITYTFGVVCMAASIGCLGLLALAPGPLWAYAYGALVGVGYSVTAPLMPAVVADFYRGRHFGTIFGSLHLANAIGGSSGPWVAGWIFDTTGSYAAAFVAALVCGGVAATALWIVAPRRLRRGRIGG
jgi:MFS family permease